ncbi:MAG: endonuclease III domain-containing protein [Bacillota bacterium]
MNLDINKRLMHIYDLMYGKVGPRNWWPADTRFEVIIGAILTQFVSWKNVTKAIENLKNEDLLSLEGICHVDTEWLEELIRCTRFYKQKARKLREFCLHVQNNYDGKIEKLFDKDIYELRKELLSLYGIGEETADCIILYAAEKPIFVVDSYTRRVFGRLGFFKEDVTYKEMQKFFMDNLQHDVRLFNEYHAQIDGIGSCYCDGKKPKCSECPLKSVCVNMID